MEKLEKDMLLVVDEPTAQSYNNGTMVGVDQSLQNIDVVSPSMLKSSPIFVDVSGAPINVEMGRAYLRAKYFSEPNVYYEATFDSINRINRERFNMFKYVAHILGATMMTKMNVQEEEKNYGVGARFDFGKSGITDVNGKADLNTKAKVKRVEVGTDVGLNGGYGKEERSTFNVDIQSLIAKKLDRGFLQYEVFESKEFDNQRWEKAKELLLKNGLYYSEDFRNLLESRNPENGLKKFDFIQYQISSDLNKYLKLAVAIDMSNLISGAISSVASLGAGIASKGVAAVLSGIFGVNIGLDANIQAQIQNFKRESDLLVMGFEHSESCLDELDKIIEQYKKTKNLFGDGRLERKSVAEQLVEKGLSLEDVSTIAKLPVDEVQRIRERIDKKYNYQLKDK